MIEEARVAGRSAEDAAASSSKLIDADQLSRAIAERYGLDHVDLNVYHVDMGAANLLSVTAARRYQAVPVGYVDTETLLVAMADPANVLAVDDIQMITGLNCRVAVAADEDIDALIGRLNTLESAVTEAVDEDEEAELGEVTELHESADDAPVIKLVYSILGQAASEGASDIHFEPGEDEMRVRFRVDGVLHEAARVPQADDLRRRLAGEDHERPRHRREARARRTAASASTSRTARSTCASRPCRPSAGEGATIRILDKEQALRTLDELGHGRRPAASASRPPSPGPTAPSWSPGRPAPASRPRSTRRSQELNAVEKNIITIEDPVEYRIDGRQPDQRQPQGRARPSPPACARSCAPTPTSIMVGEIRDAETARIAIESALTGHMVLSTLHTNDAPGAIARLTEDGDRDLPDRLGGRLRRRPAAGAQALHPLQAAHDDLPGGAARGRLPGRRRPRGLRAGRLRALQPQRLPGPDRDLLGDGDERADQGADRRPAPPEAEIAAVAREEGMLTLREDGLAKVRAGVTSIEEVAPCHRLSAALAPQWSRGTSSSFGPS